jgi:hypothetical protein
MYGYLQHRILETLCQFQAIRIELAKKLQEMVFRATLKQFYLPRHRADRGTFTTSWQECPPELTVRHTTGFAQHEKLVR